MEDVNNRGLLKLKAFRGLEKQSFPGQHLLEMPEGRFGKGNVQKTSLGRTHCKSNERNGLRKGRPNQSTNRRQVAL